MTRLRLLLYGLIAIADGVLLRSTARSGASNWSEWSGGVLILVGIALTLAALAMAMLRARPRLAEGRGRAFEPGLVVVLVVLSFAAAPVAFRTTRPEDVEHASGVQWASVSSQDLRIAALFGTARDRGLDAALDDLEELAARDTAIAGAAHALAHALGRFAISERGTDPAIVRECRSAFHSGCYHGVIEALLRADPGFAGDRLATLCDVSDPRPMARIECAHGVGHGLVAAKEHDLAASLAACKAFSSAARHWCYSGAFMESVNAWVLEEGAGEVTGGHGHGSHAAGHAHRAAAVRHDHVRPDDPHYPCNVVEEEQRGACYMYAPFVMLRLNDWDHRAMRDACALAEPAWVGACFTGYGTQLAGMLPNDPARVLRLCAAMGSEGEAPCVAGAVELLVDWEWKTEPGYAFCAAADGEARVSCFERIGSRLVLFEESSESRASECGAAGEPSDVQACRRGARLDS